MFSQKKRNYRNWIWAAIAFAAIAFAVVLLLGYLGRNNDEPYAQTNGNEQVYEQSDAENESKSNDAEEEEATDIDDLDATASDSEAADKDEETMEPKEVFQSYYLVKYDNDVIRIYFSDQSGKITELEETTIVYETLSAEDQKRFQDGVKLDSRDDLNKLLMDYES